jgi:hypothetical protein
MKDSKEKGAVQILCEEIGATYIEKMESVDVLVAFVSVLVDEIDGMMGISRQIQHLTDEKVSVGAEEALKCVKDLLLVKGRKDLIKASESAHRVTYVSDDGPCDHNIDMLSSCVSAIRFGLEIPSMSRHAAEAANHIWKFRYGVSLFDRHSSGWSKEWSRSKFYEALGSISAS